MIRTYPAYARTIASHIVRGQKPVCVAVLLSTRWRYFDQVPKVCIRPEEWEPRHYEFGYLRGMHVVAVPGDDCTDLQLAELLVDLMTAAPRLLWAFQTDGAKLYDGDHADDVSEWVRSILVRDGVDWRQRWPAIKAAEAKMREAQLRSGERFETEGQRIQEKSGVEAFVRWASWQQIESKDRVRALFATPTAVGEPLSA